MQLPAELIEQTWLFGEAYTEREWERAETIAAANLADCPAEVRERVRRALREFLPVDPSDWDDGILDPLIERSHVMWDAPEDRARLHRAFASVLDCLEAVDDAATQ